MKVCKLFCVFAHLSRYDAVGSRPAADDNNHAMASFSLSSSSRHPRFDTIVGLDVSGRVYYCHKSTLLVAGGPSSYFAARFGPDSMMDPQLDRVDENNREIYFVDRNPELFRHVLEYLRTRALPPEVGTFRDNAPLW